MFAKPLTFLLVFLLTVVNFIVLLIPVSLLCFPLLFFFKALLIEIGPSLFFFLISRISGAIIVYILLDSAFGFTMRRLRKGCVNFNKATAIYGQKEILQSFEWLKQKFKIKDVKLYLDPDFTVANAYAVGSFAGSSVTITMGLINRMQEAASSPQEYIDAIRGILGHEMSHLANKDFLPGLLTAACESGCNRISQVVRFLFMAVATIVKIIPRIGWPMAQLIILLYNFVDFLIMAFFKLLFMPVYNFLLNFFGRAIEYRCDRESAYAYGGKKMALALSFLGAKGYFSLFSTHPTTARRIKKVAKVTAKEGTIRPGIINMLSNFISLVLVVFICLYSSSLTDTANIYQHYLREIYYPMQYKTHEYGRQIRRLYGALGG